MTRDEAIAAAGEALARACAERDALPPRAAAEQALRPGGPPLHVVENQIRQQRGLPLIHTEERGAA